MVSRRRRSPDPQWIWGRIMGENQIKNGDVVRENILHVFLNQSDGKETCKPSTQHCVVEEVCQWSDYEPTCAEDEVVVMQRAMYGRMRIGQCVSEDLGYLGCKTDVLSLADRKCSGRRTCKVQIPDGDFEKTRPCSERQSYLEAQYKCVKVEGTERRQCGTCDFVKLTSPSGYIASATTEETGCGSTDCPWLIEAKPGQQIKIRLLDFGFPTGPETALGSLNVCRVYAVLKEETTRRSVTICGGQQREKDAYTTQSNTLEVRVLGKSTNAEPMYFMLHYSVLGCADLAPPSAGWVKRHGDSALVGCSASEDTWRLTCNGTHWIGLYGECPEDIQSAASMSGKNFSFVKNYNCIDGERYSVMGTDGSGKKISIAIVIIIAVFVGSVILIVGLVCFRRHNTGRGGGASRRRGAGTAQGGARLPDEAMYHERGMPPQVPVYMEHDEGGHQHTLKGRGKTYGDVRNEYAHIWEMPLPQPLPGTQMNNAQKGPEGGRADIGMSMPPMPAPLPLPPDI